MKNLFLSFVLLPILSMSGTAAEDGSLGTNPQPTATLSEFDQGIALTSAANPDQVMYYWIFEGAQFDAMEKNEDMTNYTPGRGKRRLGHWRAYASQFRKVTISEDGKKAIVKIQNAKDPAIDMLWTFTATAGGAEIELKVKNVSSYDWPEMASFHPCFHPGVFSTNHEKLIAEGKTEQKVKPNRQFVNRNTWFLTEKGLTKLDGGLQHSSTALEKQHETARKEKKQKKPIVKPSATDGFLVRVSNDGKWVTGVAWNDFRALSAHHPYRCMHNYIRVGPLKQGETKTLKGRLYLFEGTKEDCLQRYRKEFKQQEEE